MPTPDTTEPPRHSPGLGARLLWFVGLWAASVAVVALVAYAIKWALPA
jgi:hypothetical protein